eukprot:gene9784-biopygen10768
MSLNFASEKGSLPPRPGAIRMAGPAMPKMYGGPDLLFRRPSEIKDGCLAPGSRLVPHEIRLLTVDPVAPGRRLRTRPGRVYFFKFYRVGRVRDASAAVSPSKLAPQKVRPAQCMPRPNGHSFALEAEPGTSHSRGGPAPPAQKSLQASSPAQTVFKLRHRRFFKLVTVLAPGEPPKNASLERASLERASLERASLERASLERASLEPR